MTRLGTILRDVFTTDRCDFCPGKGKTYIDPETQCRYCLNCLVLAAEAEQDMAAADALPEDPAALAIAREVMATRRAA